MPFTKEEQKVFEQMFEEATEAEDDIEFLIRLGDVLLEMTGNVNLAQRLKTLGLTL